MSRQDISCLLFIVKQKYIAKNSKHNYLKVSRLFVETFANQF